MSLFEVAFSGELVAGADMEQVKANLAKIFQANDQRMDQLFSGRRIVIKNNLDAAGAERYRETLARAGALLEVRIMAAESPAQSPAAGPAAFAAADQPAVAGAGRTARLKVAPRDEYMAAFINVDAPDLGIAPLGADLQDPRQGVEAPRVDFDQFSLAPVGSDMGQEINRPTPPPPDTSHLRLKD